MYVSKEEAEEAWYTDARGVNTANAAVLFNDTFRIVLRAKKAEGRQTYEAVLVSSRISLFNRTRRDTEIAYIDLVSTRLSQPLVHLFHHYLQTLH